MKTRDEVLLALNICEGHDCYCSITSPKCPYFKEDDVDYGFPDCFNDMKKDVLYLLNEQKEERERLVSIFHHKHKKQA